MSLLLRLYPGDYVVHLVLVFALQIAVVAGAAWVMARWWARRNAAALYAVWLTALLSVPLGAVMLAASSGAGLTLIPLPLLPADRPAPPTVEYARATFGPSADTGAEVESGAAACENTLPFAAAWLARHFRDADTYRALFSLAMIAWALGALWFAVRLAIGLYSLGRLLRYSRPIRSSRYAQMCTRIVDQLGLRRTPRLLTSEWVTSPICLGLWRPAIILPEGLSARLSTSQLQDVLVHECGHILNRDHFWGLLERFVQIVLWPHPAVHLIRQELSRAREELCDNYVLRNARVPDYARTLLMISQQLGHDQPRYLSAIGFLQGPHPLESRVRALLDSRRQLATQMPGTGRAAVGGGLLVLALVAAGVRLVPAAAPLPLPMAAVVEFHPIPAAAAGPSTQASLLLPTQMAAALPSRPDAGTQAARSFEPAAELLTVAGPASLSPTVATAQSAAKPRAGGEPAISPVPRQTSLAQVGNIGARLGRAFRSDEMGNDSTWKSESVASRRGTTTPTLTEVVFDLTDALQPMIHVEPVDGIYWVTVQVGDSSAARWTVEPGKAAKAVYEESLTARITCELYVDPTEHAGQVRVSYRWTLQLGLDQTFVWQSQGEIIPCGQWRPLMPAMASGQPSVRTTGAAMAADELMQQCNEAVRLFGIVLEMLND